MVCLNTLLFDTYSPSEVHTILQCRCNHLINHIVIGEICSPCNRSWHHELVYCFRFLNFFDPLHSELRVCSFWTLIWLSRLLWPTAWWFEGVLKLHILQSWSWLSSFGIPISLGVSQDAVPRSDISENPSHHFENKFLQSDTKGSGFQDLD